MTSKAQKEAYDRWFEKNKTKLYEKRKKRYAEDPEYRARVLQTVAKSKEANKDTVSVPEQYKYTIQQLASSLNVTVAQLRWWRDKEYYPEPAEFNGRLYFTESQKELLTGLVGFFSIKRRRRMSSSERANLEVIVALIYCNWG